jgi:hypothetical protein
MAATAAQMSVRGRDSDEIRRSGMDNRPRRSDFEWRVMKIGAGIGDRRGGCSGSFSLN